MNTLPRPFKNIPWIVLSLLMAFTLPASAETGAVGDLRAEQVRIDLERDLLRAQMEMLQEHLDQGRTVYVQLRLPDMNVEGDIVTLSEGIKVWTQQYLQTILHENKPYSSADLAALIKARRDKAIEFKVTMEHTVDELKARIAQLDRRWKVLEAQIAGLMAPPLSTPQKPPAAGPSGPSTIRANDRACVEAVSVERLFELGKAAIVESNAGTHSASHSGVFQGQHANGTVTWTAPPLTLCVGDEFVIEMIAENAAPKYKRGVVYVAAVSVHPTSRALEVVSCSNPPRNFGPSNNSAAVNSSMTSYANTCTYRVKSVDLSRTPKGYIAADLTAKPSYGKVTYLYRAASKK